MAADNGNMPSDDDMNSSSSDEIEPRLKYVRMTNDVLKILNKDAASCMAVHPKFVCLGTHWGTVHLLDHQGNNIKSKALRSHTVSVNQISIDQNGDFVASCSDDGRIFISGLCSSEHNQEVVIGRLVRCVAIDPYYSKPGSGRRFITGDERLVFHEKTFLSRIRTTVLYEAEGTVQNIKWNGQFVAWASNIGVRVYDMYGQCSLGLIKWTRNPEALPECYRCNLCWKTATTLLVGWVDTVRVCIIRKRTPIEMVAGDFPEFVVEPVSTFTTEFYICGIGPLNSNLVLLGYSKEPDSKGKAQRPQLYVVEPGTDDYTEICTDSLSMRGYQEYKCNEYHLECLIEENRFFIVSPKDIVVASPYDADDRIQWLIEHGKYEAAMEAVIQFEGRDLKKHDLLNVGRAYLDHLLSVQRYQEAAELCVKILGRDKRLWEEEVFKFVRLHQLRAVSPYLPRGEPSLDPHIYEMVLYEYLKMDPKGFLKTVKEWSPTLYNVPAVVNAVLEHLLVNDTDKTLLLEALAILYSHEHKHDKALAMYLKLHHKDAFQLIQEHNLYSSIYDTIEELMDLDSEQAINMFLEKDRVPVDVVVKALENNHRYLYLYLDALDKRDTKEVSRKYHGLLVRLYADFAREKLLPFLRRSDQYPIVESLQVCEERSFYPELVFILGRIGRPKQALNIIMQQLNDIDRAINFCKEHNDNELWEDLIQYSLEKPEFITFLLQKIGTYIDPRKLVQRIKTGMEIPGLKNSLVKMMKDYNLQVSVQEGCKKIIVSDYFSLHKKLVRSQDKGISVDDEQVCGACHGKIIVRDISHATNIIVFFCKHLFHEECLPTLDSVGNCVICKSIKRPGNAHTPVMKQNFK
ncbi:vacuolar protein sorting-associated protein 41 homolog isoform X1 [Schistocerca serialis cubense]|uniref:vacuolar protein sorting-associated protein 41 homolog isoform X1 n=1 Tax=Schistocerca serialis cubense TaxID=2023355 RepID=UPI00214E8E76|nr:vacuolar protein sorting-associated protein 41 homolog isoform X1 [Schistocerca serialis cubense]